MVTNEPVPRPLATSFALSETKYFFFSISWKYRRVPIWLKTFNPKGYAAKYRYQKGELAKTGISQTQEIKAFST